MIAGNVTNTATCVSNVFDMIPIFVKGLSMIQWVYKLSVRNLCLGARAVALLVGFGICCGGGDVFAQFTAVNSITGLPDGAVASTATSTAVGPVARAIGPYATALGQNSTASGASSTSLGVGSTASGLESTALGQNSTASGTNASALGRLAQATGTASTGVGTAAAATGTSSTATGALAQATADYTTAVGQAANASGQQATALGFSSTASATAATALGEQASASGDYSTAVGKDAQVTNQYSTAVGALAGTSGDNGTALGYLSSAGQNATALGQGTTAGFANSTAIGQGAATTADNQIMLGTATNTYTAPGITSSASTAAQTGTREIVTTDSSGNLASDTAAGLGLASTADISALQQDVSRNTEGVAMAMALGGIPTVLPVDTNRAISASWGTFGGKNALAVGGSARLHNNIFLNGGGALGTRGRGSNAGGRAGLTFAW